MLRPSPWLSKAFFSDSRALMDQANTLRTSWLPAVAFLLLAAVFIFVVLGKQSPGVVGTSKTPPELDRPDTASEQDSGHRTLAAHSLVDDVARHDAERLALAEQAERRELATHEALATRFSTENVDAGWASAKESRMQVASASEQISSIHAEPQNLVIDCRSSLCKISGDFQSRGLAEDWLTLFSTDLGNEMPTASYRYLPNQDGSFHLVVYGLGRK